MKNPSETVGTAMLLAMLLALVAAAAHADGVLYFAEVFTPTFDDGSIRRIDTDGTGLQALVCTGDGVRGLAIDLDTEAMYWTDVDAGTIARCGLDAVDPAIVLISGLAFPNAIALDTANGRIYWGDQTADEIRSIALDGSDLQLVVSTPFHWGLAIDAMHGKLYWSTSLAADFGSIMRANLDGTDVETVVEDVGKPAWIAIDAAGGRVYWTDFVGDVVRRANVDGTRVEDLFVVGANDNPNAIALDLTAGPAAGKVYWGQDAAGIMRMDLDGANPEVVAPGYDNVVGLEFTQLTKRPSTCPGDFDDDSFVTTADLLALLADWGPCPECNGSPLPCPSDINGDGAVDALDLQALIEGWGPCG